jgi:hypothetical protein
MKLRNYRVDVSFEDSKVARGVSYWNRYYNTHEVNGPVMYSAFVYGVRNRENAYRIVQKCHGAKIHRAGYVGASTNLIMKSTEVRKDGKPFGTPEVKVIEEVLELPRKERVKPSKKRLRRGKVLPGGVKGR